MSDTLQPRRRFTETRLQLEWDYMDLEEREEYVRLLDEAKKVDDTGLRAANYAIDKILSGRVAAGTEGLAELLMPVALKQATESQGRLF